MIKKKIIINTPIVSIPAGVANHYLGLRKFFSNKVIYNQYATSNYIKNKIRIKIFHKPLIVGYKCHDIIKFIFFLMIYCRPTILLNPSFGRTALKRDALFLSIAKFFKCKVAVFIHGWDKEYLEMVFNGTIKFSAIWKKADAFFVLAKEFKDYLEKLGIKSPIHLTTTKVNDKLLEGISKNKKIEKIQNILFLARVEKAKGVFITIDAFNILIKKYSNLKLRVVGSGSVLEHAKTYVSDRGISNITFAGALYGADLKKEFFNADLYILPTTHGEGMPTSVLEAMAFGLPVITRPVGGLKDFFENDKMGYMIENLDPKEYAAQIEKLIKDVYKANEISDYNKQYAKEHFMASKIAPLIERKLKEL